MGKTILVAEDTRTTRDVVSFLLSSRGYEVLEAVNGVDALQIMRSRPPDLVILDAEMPEKSGYDVFRDMKYDDRCKNIPILFMVANTDVIDVTKSVPAAEFLVAKPFTAHDLLQRVSQVLG